jgi:hypothetical protein
MIGMRPKSEELLVEHAKRARRRRISFRAILRKKKNPIGIATA